MKITDIEISENNVKSAPDVLNADGEKSARDIKHIFDRLPELIAGKYNRLVDYINDKLCTKDEMAQTVMQEVKAIGAEEIARQIYDSDNDGMVDNAKHLNGQPAGYYATKTEVETAQKNAISTYEQSANMLTGSGENGKFKATATGTYTEFTIDGVSYAVKAGGETEIELTSGVWYSFIIDADEKTINFKAGGGVGNSKLALATATESDVLSGAKFYAGDKTLKTGTLATTVALNSVKSATSNRTVSGLTAGKRYLVISLYPWSNSETLSGCSVKAGPKQYGRAGENGTVATVRIWDVVANGTSITISSGAHTSYQTLIVIPI